MVRLGLSAESLALGVPYRWGSAGRPQLPQSSESPQPSPTNKRIPLLLEVPNKGNTALVGGSPGYFLRPYGRPAVSSSVCRLREPGHWRGRYCLALDANGLLFSSPCHTVTWSVKPRRAHSPSSPCPYDWVHSSRFPPISPPRQDILSCLAHAPSNPAFWLSVARFRHRCACPCFVISRFHPARRAGTEGPATVLGSIWTGFCSILLVLSTCTGPTGNAEALSPSSIPEIPPKSSTTLHIEPRCGLA